MRLSLLISLSLLLLSWQKALAQLAPAADFFDSGAQFYISNNIPQAKEMTEMGLKLYPEDDKLKKLEQLLNQKQQQQQQQNQQQQKQQSKSDSQKNQQQKNQQPQPQNSAGQQKPDAEKQKQAAQQKSEQERKQDQQKAQGQKPDNEKPDQGQPDQAQQMTPDEAKRLLDAQKDSEQILPLKPAEQPRDPLRPVKDW